MGKSPKRRRGWADVGVAVGGSLSTAGTRGGQNNHTRRLITAPRTSGSTASRSVIEAWFTHEGLVTVGDELSVAYEPSQPLTLVSARGRLTTAGSSTTTVTVYRNETSIGTVSWGSGDTLATATFDDDFAADTDLLQVQCTTADADASGISIRFGFAR